MYKGHPSMRDAASSHSSQPPLYYSAHLYSIVLHYHWTPALAETSANSLWLFVYAAQSRRHRDPLLSHRVSPCLWCPTPWPGQCNALCNTSGRPPRSCSHEQSDTRRGNTRRGSTDLMTEKVNVFSICGERIARILLWNDIMPLKLNVHI